ncbi:hypothetical protein QT464_22450, partial [Xanthomonas citri pv. citri]
PYKTPGGIVTSSIALVLACAAVVAGLMVNPKVWCLAALIYGLFILYYLLYSRHHLVEGTPEQEFASIEIRDE